MHKACDADSQIKLKTDKWKMFDFLKRELYLLASSTMIFYGVGLPWKIFLN